MLYPRIIPCLLVHQKGLIKTVRFRDPKYVGDPINAVKIFNEKEVDELIVLDIDATVEHREPDYKLIEHLAVECRMPLCYGGGIKTVEQAQRIFNLGVEKIAVSSLAVEHPEVVAEIARRVGNQSVVVVMDVKKTGFRGRYELVIHNATKSTGIDPVQFALKMQELGIGELVINSVDQDGMMTGYDHKLIDSVKEVLTIPVTVMGGAGNLSDMGEIIRKHSVIGVAAGSMFVFKGKYRAVLINYPTPIEKEAVFNEYFLSSADSVK